MSKVLYYIFILPLSLLPMRVLYFISDFFYFIGYYLIGYRKKVVQENLKNAFPNKSSKELLRIEEKFYHYLFDLIVETLKSFSASKEFWLKRVRFNFSDAYLNQTINYSSIVVLPHYGNWEWSCISGTLLKEKGIDSYGVFQPLKDQFLNQKMLETRNGLGIQLISTKESKAIFEQLNAHKNQQPFTMVLIADQSPGSPNNAYWTNFLNQKTAFIYGPERYSRKYELPIFVAKISNPRRGYYEVETLPLITKDEIVHTKEGLITENMVQIFETIIATKPELWLWSHRRWKHKHLNGVS